MSTVCWVILLGKVVALLSSTGGANDAPGPWEGRNDWADGLILPVFLRLYELGWERTLP